MTESNWFFSYVVTTLRRVMAVEMSGRCGTAKPEVTSRVGGVSLPVSWSHTFLVMAISRMCDVTFNKMFHDPVVT